MLRICSLLNPCSRLSIGLCVKRFSILQFNSNANENIFFQFSNLSAGVKKTLNQSQRTVATISASSTCNSSNSCCINFILLDGTKRVIQGKIGQTLLEVAHQHDIDIEGACDASLACSTCHVILDRDSFQQLPEPSEREEDLLDMAPYVTDTSRLSCQIRLTEKENGMEVRLPPSTLNFYVDGYRPKPH